MANETVMSAKEKDISPQFMADSLYIPMTFPAQSDSASSAIPFSPKIEKSFLLFNLFFKNFIDMNNPKLRDKVTDAGKYAANRSHVISNQILEKYSEAIRDQIPFAVSVKPELFDKPQIIERVNEMLDQKSMASPAGIKQLMKQISPDRKLS